MQIVWRWDGNNPQPDRMIFLASVDGTHCHIYEQRTRPSTKWYSHKFNGPGVVYELAVDLYDDKLLWVNGPFQAGDSDIAVFRKPGGLSTKVPIGRKLIADNGYHGQEHQISAPNRYDAPEVNEFKRRARSRHETFNKRIKDFSIISTRFRSDVEKHQTAFESVCILVQYDIENGHPLFRIA